MEYNDQYYLTHDIDYFLIFRGEPIHVASNGSIPPECIIGEKNREIQKMVYDAQINGGFEERKADVNRNAIIRILENTGHDNVTDNDIDNYAESFESFAKMGFHSYDTIGTDLVKICGSTDTGGVNGNFIMPQSIPSVPDDFFTVDTEKEKYWESSVLSRYINK